MRRIFRLAATFATITSIATISLLPSEAFADKAAEAGKSDKTGGWTADTFQGLSFREVGPALTSGRIVDLAVDPGHKATWYVAVASGGVWKTTNAGTTWTPLFDNEGSYSIGCVSLDPNNSQVVWVGSGENNSQRSVGFGDGVYKSLDGGKTWKNVGLKNSEHIGKILIDPRDSDTVYVAAQGPLWSPGGDRGLYKTTDGGKTWKAVLSISENTGVSDIVFDPRDPDVIYASSYQRRRHVYTVINGGPEGGLHKTTDGGATWTKLTAGLPKEDIGRIGLTISPAAPDRVYAIVEAARQSGGVFRSDDSGASWQKMNSYVSGSGQYYQELFADPKNPDRVYSMDVISKVSEDGGKTWKSIGELHKHVDSHAMWINPDDTDHIMIGCDGGLYESWDRGTFWNFKANLPVTQFYRVSVDNSLPFYYIYGGTQDNFSLGGPSRTNTVHGIANSDWFVTKGGDGFETVVDPENPNILYAEAQHGELVRFDRKSGEKIGIKPEVGKGEAPLRFNWDSPLMISPHSSSRLYFAANRVFRSDDRGNSWKVISPDLSQQIDRNQFKVMGRIWSVDSVAKSASTSLYGNIVSMDESPKQENLLYIGTDDGLIQATEDVGATWRKTSRFPGVPENTYVSYILASQHDAGTVYAAFDNHKNGDFKPYLLKSTDKGATWTSIASDLPARGTVYSIAQDHVDPDLIFAGTEFGAFFTRNGGRSWIQFKGGLPVIAVRDMAIQRRENDLVLGTFGRGFWVLDDYTPLRNLQPAALEQDLTLFPVKQPWLYAQAEPLGLRGKAFQGENYYTAANPPFGAVFTYHLKDEIKTRKKLRQEAERKLLDEKKDLPYPSWQELREEDREEAPQILFTVTDEKGNVVRRITGPVTKGFHRVSWDLRFPPPQPTDLDPVVSEMAIFGDPLWGPLAAPGRYTVTAGKWVDGQMTPIGQPQTFNVAPLTGPTFPAADRATLLDFQRKTSNLQRAVLGAVNAVDEAQVRLDNIRQALIDTPGGEPSLMSQARALELRLTDIKVALEGDTTVSSRNAPTPPSIQSRVGSIVDAHWNSTSEATATQREAYRVTSELFAPVLQQLRTLVEVDLRKLEEQMETIHSPWTPGRVPVWQPE